VKLSTKGRYGLRALIDLAACDSGEAISIQSIARRQNISESYLEQLMRLMRKADLVVSVRGAGGGYRLARPAEKISVGDILRALEGSLEAVTCPGNQEDKGCEGADYCVARYVWKRINDSITQAVDNIMLDQLAQESRRIQEKGSPGNIICNN
jgi:Rrf2 family iron-sulfur cluster assembly transcriptional regulator